MKEFPLDNVTVIDFTQILAGPFCTMLLADMGANVIKIEKPNGGDDTRRFGPPFLNGESVAFIGINRNKRSIVLDLKTETGVDVARSMIAKADIVIQNSRPGAMDRMGLNYERVCIDKPGLIYCTISGFGATGPYSHKAGFDLVAQGMSGLMSITGLPGSPPIKAGVPVADFNTGMYSTYAILSAYIHKLKTGKGQHVDASLLDSAIAYTLYESMAYFATGDVATPVGSAHRMIAPYQAFATSDGYINVAAANQSNWVRLCNAIGREDLLKESRFSSNSERMIHIGELTPIMDRTFSKETTGYWVTLLEKAGVPCGPIYNMAQVYADPQVRARNMAVELEHPVAGKIRNIGVPVKLSETPGEIYRPAPTLGQHTLQILSEFGFSPGEIANYKELGVVQ